MGRLQTAGMFYMAAASQLAKQVEHPLDWVPQKHTSKTWKLGTEILSETQWEK